MATTRTTDGGRPVTGWTVLYWMLAFFAVIFAVNGVFIYYALGTFPGLEVASSYKAGQEFRAEVEAAHAQDERGWTVDLSAGLGDAGAEIAVTFTSRDGYPEAGLTVTAELEHPTMTSGDRMVVLAETEPGRYRGIIAGEAAGRRMLVLTATRGGERLFMSRNALMLAN
ncbi:FixH family protein [Chthonobacter albigriseus]|uniref:FixH family protein n=1 Tax=Chthonobacter albigriseus TaxID=1683161 RepID=UPI0015EEEED1|nr:FixH family protein [Chthonobacter albigriseus]